MSSDKLYQGTILTTHSYDQGGRNLLEYFGVCKEGPFCLRVSFGQPLFFVERQTSLNFLTLPHKRKSVDLLNFSMNPVDALYFETLDGLIKAREILREKGIPCFEADVRTQDRYLMERFIKAQVEFKGEAIIKDNLLYFADPQIRKGNHGESKFSLLSVDIETGRRGELYSIGLHFQSRDKQFEKQLVLMINSEKPGESVSLGEGPGVLKYLRSEPELLREFLKELNLLDPDMIIGWNVVGFDLKFLDDKFKRFNIPMDLGRGKGLVKWRERQGRTPSVEIPGRVVVDGPWALRFAFYQFENFRLESVAQELLGEGKYISSSYDKVQEIERRFREEKVSLARYNLKDAVLVTRIFEKTQIIDHLITRSMISGLPIDRLGFSTQAFDFLFLPELHRHGFVAPNIADVEAVGGISGGHVLEPVQGLHENILVFDFKSLYPSLMRTFKIDPLSRILAGLEEVSCLETPTGHKFSRDQHILPELLAELLERRKKAQASGNQHLSQAIKILMNSLYGVMGSTGSRFFHPDLPTAITGTGQWCLKTMAKFFTSKGHQVLYGDTDSLFIKPHVKNLPNNSWEFWGENMAKEANQFMDKTLEHEFGLTSYLDLEFEKHYLKFFLPPVRSGGGGAKKRYVGLLKNSETDGLKLDFVGMEYVRSDWTKLAKNFQYGLFERIFLGGEVEKWIKEYVTYLKNGQFDQLLIYRKRLTKPLEEYTKTLPPHVRAAKILWEQTGQRFSSISYVMTNEGAWPYELWTKHTGPQIDYEHYIEKQLRPLADGVLDLIHASFDGCLGSSQLSFL